MSLGTLALVWVGLMALRTAFFAFHLRDPETLWHDFERRGLRYQVARGLDYLTLIAFGVAAVFALWGVTVQTPDRLWRVFVAWLGFLLLERLPLHRFPRTNRPGAMLDAQVSLGANVLIALLGAAAASALAAVYFAWRG
jgi:hypothetical protein